MYIQDESGNKIELLLSPSGDTYPIGMMAFTAGDKAPTNWLRCDGRLVLKSEYPELFNAIGTIHNKETDTDETKFRLPNVNLEHRTLVGSSGDGEFSVGNTGGEKEHLLTLDETPISVFNATGTSGTWTYLGTKTDNNPHNNMPPYMAGICCIKAKQSAGIVGDVTNNINDLNENAVPNAKTVKDYVDNQPQVIYCKKSTDYTTSQAYKQIDDWTQLIKVGNELSVKNGKVVIGKDIHNIKIINKMRLTGTDGEMIFSYLLKNGSNLTDSWFIHSFGGTDMTFMNETIINVSEGDTITASIYGGGSSLKADATTLIVEKIN